MEKSKKIKLFVGLFYLIFISLFLFYLFSKFSFQELTSYEFIKNNVNYFSDLKKNNIFFLSLSFLFFVILWVFPFLGFGAPIALLGGFILGKWLGTAIIVLGLSIGATFLYIFANFFGKSIFRNTFLTFKIKFIINIFEINNFLIKFWIPLIRMGFKSLK